MKRNIFIITSSRADYDHLFWLIKDLEKIYKFNLNLVVTGYHMEKRYGKSVNLIQLKKKIKIHKIEINFNSDSKNSTSKILSEIIKKSSFFFNQKKPDLVIVLGDRFEIFGCAIGASINNLPLAHLNGGELTAGAVDEWLRHSITKMSKFHFVANRVYKKRVIQLGEHPKNVYCTGGLSADNVKKTKILKRKTLEDLIGRKLMKKNILITYHPETLNKSNPGKLFSNILKSLEAYKNVGLFFTSPNADPGNFAVTKMIKKFAEENKNACFFVNLGREKYLSLLSHCNILLGNSSSGILEAPYLNTYTINVGDRQLGRLKSKTIFDVENKTDKISSIIKKLIIKKKPKNIKYMYGDGNASKKIVKIIKSINFDAINLKKKFYDL